MVMGEIRDPRQKNLNEGNNDNWKIGKKLKQKKSRNAVRVSVKSISCVACGVVVVWPGVSSLFDLVCCSCMTSDQLEVEFVSNSRLSLSFQTRVAKFDGFLHVYIRCTAVLCHQAYCDRSCHQPGTATTTITTTTSGVA